MAPFSKRQIGYIKAVAGVGQHKSFINYANIGTAFTPLLATPTPGDDYTDEQRYADQPSQGLTVFPFTNASGSYNTNGKQLAGALFCLNTVPLTVDDTDSSTDLNVHKFQQIKFEKLMKVNRMFLLSQQGYTEGDEPTLAPTINRVGDDFYLESTHIKWRFTMPDFSDPAASGKQPHHEYRFIVFRQRKPTLQRGDAPTGDNAQWLNFNYDLFSGYHGRRVGWSGHRRHEEFDGDELYDNKQPLASSGLYENISLPLTTDDIMTLPLNDADYVIMRDERFFLGAEHGKSHFETMTRFEWSDQGSEAAAKRSLIPGLDDSKNYDWFFLVLGTSNDDVTPQLNISVRGVTALTSA